MVRKHISRDYSMHEKEIIRPTDDYCMFEVFAYDPKYTKIYIDNKDFKTSNAKRTNFRAWTPYMATDGNKSQQIKFYYNVVDEGEYLIEFLYEKDSQIYSNTKLNVKKNIVGDFKIINKSKTIHESRITFDGHNNIIKRKQVYTDLKKGKNQLEVSIPPNCYFYGVIVRKIKYYFGDNLDSADSNMMLTEASFTDSDMAKASELTVTIGYDDDFECEDSPSGFYIDYMNECNLYIKDITGKKQRIFGGYVSSITADNDRTKLTISCADRLRDGTNKYVLDELVLQQGTKDLKENDYTDNMELSFETYNHALKYLCDIHENTLKSNITKNYLVDGEKNKDGFVLTFGSKKKVKQIRAENGVSTIQNNFITLRNNSESKNYQKFTVYDAKEHTSVPIDITNYGYFNITYGLGEPKTEIKSKETSTVEATAGAVKFNKCGVSSDGKYIMAIGLPSAGKDSKKGFTKAVFERKCPYCGSKELYWGFMWTGNFPCTKRFNNGSAGRYEGHIYCDSCDMDFSVQGWEHISGSNRRLKLTSPVVASSRAEANKLKSGQMVAVPTSGASFNSDDIFKNITKIAFKYRYKLGTSSSYSAMKKSGYGDCWAFSDLIYTELKKYKVSCRIVQYATAYASNHQSVQYKNDKGQWVDFPYRAYGWNTRYNNMLNNTSASSRGSVVALYNGNTIGKASSGGSGSSSETTTVTTINGYDKDKPFQAYIELTYSLEQSFSAKQYKIYIDFTQTPNFAETISGLKTYWINKTTRRSSLPTNIVEFIKRVIHTNADRIYLHQIMFITPKKVQEQGTDNDWFKYDNSTQDNASCKIDLYQIAFVNSKETEPSELNSCGKSINSLLGDLVKESGYLVSMTYGLHRKDDVINFRIDNDTKIRFTATEGDNNNILAWNSISYTPISSMFNNSLQVYKGHDEKYHYIETRSPSSIFKYQEQCTLATSNDNIGSKEAYWNAINSEKYNPVQTYNYSVTVPNYPHLRIGDMVKVTSNAKKLNTIKTISSIKVTFKISDMPRIKTELGLGEISPDLQVKEVIRNLRRNAKKETTYFSSSASPVNDKTVYEWDN